MLGKILRGKWGFQGMVTSDSGAVADISSAHHYTPDLASATVAAVSAGCDVESAGWGNDPAKGIGPWATGKAPRCWSHDHVGVSGGVFPPASFHQSLEDAAQTALSVVVVFSSERVLRGQAGRTSTTCLGRCGTAA